MPFFCTCCKNVLPLFPPYCIGNSKFVSRTDLKETFLSAAEDHKHTVCTNGTYKKIQNKFNHMHNDSFNFSLSVVTLRSHHQHCLCWQLQLCSNHLSEPLSEPLLSLLCVALALASQSIQ